MSSSPPVAKLRYADLLSAFEFVSPDGLADRDAYIDRETGAIHWVSSELDLDDESPPDLETSDRYIAVPDKHDLDLGRRLALSFVGQELPGDHDTVTGFFRKKGAYARFKNFLESHNLLQRWYDFEARKTEEALRDWCRDEKIAIIDDQPGQEQAR